MNLNLINLLKMYTVSQTSIPVSRDTGKDAETGIPVSED